MKTFNVGDRVSLCNLGENDCKSGIVKGPGYSGTNCKVLMDGEPEPIVVQHANMVHSPSVDEVSTENHDGIKVVHMCSLLDGIFGQDAWMGKYELASAQVMAWVKRNDACYYAWEGESFLRLAELDNGLRKTKADGKTVLVIEAMS
jgi:hypothetical protein